MERRKYLGQFLALFTGTALSQAFNFAAYPLLARLYSPADFGVLGTFVAAAAIPGALACGRFELALAIAPSSGRQAVLWLSLIIAAGVATLATGGMAAYWWHIGAPMLGITIPLLFTSILLTGAANALTMYLMRHELFRFASMGGVVRTFVTVTVQVGVVLVWRSPGGLLLGFALGLVAQTAVALAIARAHFPIGMPRGPHMRAMFRRFRPQVSVDIPGSILAALSVNLLPFFLQFLYGTRAVGYYTVGQRLAVVPLQLFNDSLSQTFYQRAARARETRGEFWQEFGLTLLLAGSVSVVMLGGIMLLAEPVISIYLGKKWMFAGTILVTLAPMLAIRSVVMSVATTVFVLRRPQWLLFHNIASVVAIAAAFIFALVTRTSLLSFVTALAVVQGVEYAAFGTVLFVAVRHGNLRAVGSSQIIRQQG